MRVKPFICGGAVLGSIALAGFLGGCGSATSNDQGTSFTLLGLFSEAPSDTGDDELPVGLAGLETSITETSEVEDDSGSIRGVIGMQNNLSGQFIRPVRVSFSYFVPGASDQPPSTTYPIGGIVGPAPAAADAASDAGSTGGGSSLPPNFGGGVPSNRLFSEVPLVDPNVRAYISLNRADFPETPFTMESHITVTGVTSAGDTIETNEQVYFIIFTSDTPITPTGPSSSAGGSSSDDSSSDDSGA